MKEILPVIGKDGEIGQIELKDGEKLEQLTRTKLKPCLPGAEIEYDTRTYLLRRMAAPSGKRLPNGLPEREIRLELYVDVGFAPAGEAEEHLMKLDKFVYENGPLLFSFASRFDNRSTLERWKP